MGSAIVVGTFGLIKIVRNIKLQEKYEEKVRNSEKSLCNIQTHGPSQWKVVTLCFKIDTSLLLN